MKKNAPMLIGILVCIIVMGVGSYWALRLMSSVYAFHSPLHSSPPIAGEPVSGMGVRSLVLVLVDGLRYDTSMDSTVMPYLNQLRNRGASAIMHSRPPSVSQPGYSVILTGAWPEMNDGPVLNWENVDVPYLDWEFVDIPPLTQDNIFADVHRAGLQTAVSGSNWFAKLIPQNNISMSYYTASGDLTADRDVVAAALPWLQAGNYPLVMIHLDQVDYAGHHEGGPVDARWTLAANRVDGLIKQIATSMDFRMDVLMIVSDHGHLDTGGHGGQDAITLLEPFVLVGKGVMPGKYGDIQMVDVAPTVSTILGTSLPAINQGHPQIAMLDLSLDQVDEINTSLAKQQDQLVLAYQTAIGRTAKVQPASDIVTASQDAIQAARKSLLDSQMLPRGIIAIIIVFLVVNFAGWHSKPYFGSMLVGVLGYLAVFNLKYLLIDHHTYSLSWLVDANSFIGGTALTILIALLVGWLLVMLGSKIYQTKPRQAADLTMKFILVLLSGFSIPIFLNYALNGATVTWALPDFLTSYLGFIFLIQAVMVAIIGLFFTGLAAVLSVFARQR